MGRLGFSHTDFAAGTRRGEGDGSAAAAAVAADAAVGGMGLGRARPRGGGSGGGGGAAGEKRIGDLCRVFFFLIEGDFCRWWGRIASADRVGFVFTENPLNWICIYIKTPKSGRCHAWFKFTICR